MNARDFSIIELRPQILTARIFPDMSAEEYFQNKVLRPIIKLQNDLLIEVFKNYKDIKFRNSLKGIIVGQFTVDEYKAYTENSSALNKRMMNLLIQRIQDVYHHILYP